MTTAQVQISDRAPIQDYSRAVDLLFKIQNELQVDLRVLIRLLQAFFEVSEGQVLLPRATDYPPTEGLQQQITLAIESMGAKTLVHDKMVRILPSIITVYRLYSMRVDAVAVQNSTAAAVPGILYPPPSIAASVDPSELQSAEIRVQFLRPIDDVVEYFYKSVIRRPRNDPTFARVVDFVYRILSMHGAEHTISGQSTRDFFWGLHRPASRMYLAFMYRATQFKAEPDVISPEQVLSFSEKATQPLLGAAEQGDFIRHLFPAKVVDAQSYGALPSLTRIALRYPYEVWPTLNGACLQCGKADAKFKCSLCGRIWYCNGSCQTSHWKASHKVACSMYRLLPLFNAHV